MARQHYSINPDPVININDASSTFVETHPKNTDYDVRSCRIHSSANAYDQTEPYTTAPFEHNLPDITISEPTTPTTLATAEGGIDVSITIQDIIDALDTNTADRNAIIAALSASSATLQGLLESTFGGVGQMILPINAQAGFLLTLTNHPSTEQFLLNTARNKFKADLSDFTQVRLTAAVNGGSVSPNNPRIVLKYHTSDSNTLGDYIDIGTSEVSCSVATAATLVDSGWINLAASAIADVFIVVTQIGGDGASDPTIGPITAHFR